jgi:hypothetical protein
MLLHNLCMQTNIPQWVQWLAQDADGQWWGYEAEPNRKHDGWYENEVGRYIKLDKGVANPRWADSLMPVAKSKRP